MQIDTMDALAAALQAAERYDGQRIVLRLTPALTARTTDAVLREAVVMALPAAQGIAVRILRSRGAGAEVAVKLHRRDGMRMLANHLHGEPALSPEEATALDKAREVASQALLHPDDHGRFRHVFGYLAANVRYVNTAPGQKGYPQLVSAAGVLRTGEGNCQGFADALYLLCGLCGIPAEYRCGRGERQLHVWNRVLIGGKWQDADASRAARGID